MGLFALLPLLALAGVNVVMVWNFWGWLDPPGSFVFRIAGVCFVLFEYSSLTIISRSWASARYLQALAMSVVFAALFTGSLIADFGAVVSRSSADADARAHAVGLWDAAERAEREAATEAARLTAILERQGADLPAAALHAQTEQAARRRERYFEAGLTPPRRIEEAVYRAERAEATGRARDAALARRDAAREALARMGGARPEANDPQSAQIAAVLRMVGLTVSPSQVRTALGLAIALIMKLMLVIGFWAVGSLNQQERRDDDTEPEPEPVPLAPLPPEPEPLTAIEEEERLSLPEPRQAPPPDRRADPVSAALDDLENGAA